MPIRLELTPSEYEDHVAAVLAERISGHGAVERDVRLPSRSGTRARQIDVLLRIPTPGLEEELMIVVDCKRYVQKVDVKDVEAFISMLADVGVPLGLLITTEGYTQGAIDRAKAAPGVHIQVIPVDELPEWEPPLISCEVCAEVLHEDALPGMAYIDQVDDIELDAGDGDTIEATLGYCEKCNTLYLRCPKCDTLNTIMEMRTDEWIECDSGCGVEYELRRPMVKDDLSNPTHDRLTLRIC